jgi:site-specific recombinase XerC
MLNTVTSREAFKRFLTEDEEQQLFQYMKRFTDVLARRDLQWMQLMRRTALRVSSLASLTVADARSALLHGSLELRDEDCKGGRGYEIQIERRARSALIALLAIREEQGFAPIATEPLLMSRKRNGLSVRSLQARMREWVRDAQLPVNASPHWLRHTMAKRMVANCTAPDAIVRVQLALGHHRIQTTMVYLLPSREDIREAMEMAA